MSRKRAAIAGVLSVVYPGLGHLYLREWLRAFAWLGVALLTAMLVMPESAVTAFEEGGFSAFMAASAEVPTGAFLALFMIRALNVLDAVWLGLRPKPTATPLPHRPETPTCPHCGKELDADLDFCPWCTNPIDGGAEGDGETGEVPAGSGSGSE